MVADASIYGQIKPAQPLEGPLDQYGKVMHLKALMGQGRLQDLQTQQLEQNMGEEQAVRDVFKNAPAGGTLESLVPEVLKASPKAGIDLQGKMLTQKKTAGDIAHTEAQTNEITAGHLAGAYAALAQGNGSDDAVRNVEAMMAPFNKERASAVTQQLLAMPPEKRVAFAVAQAAQNKTGQEALKLFFKDAHMQDTGGAFTPVSTSTMPGAPAPGTPIPGGVPLVKTATPGEKLTDARQRELYGSFSGKSGDLLAALAERGVALPAGLRSRAQMSATLESLASRNPDKSPDQIAEMIKSGQIGFGAEKKETQTAAAIAGRVGVAGEEITQFAPLVEEASNAIPRGKFVPINRLMQTADTNLSDPNLKKLKVYINSMMNAYDQLASRGGTDKDKRAEAHSLLTSAENHAALMAGVEAFKKEVVAAQKAADIASLPRSEREAARKDAAKPAASPANATPAAPSNKLVPAKGNVQDGYKFKGGDPAKQESWEKV